LLGRVVIGMVVGRLQHLRSHYYLEAAQLLSSMSLPC
jgi:hypothetical protein